jgi:hypothetical protein
MGYLVDTRPPRLGRVTLADCQQKKRRLRRLSVDAENRSPLTIRLRDVVLHASPEPRSVARLGVAWAQLIDGDALELQLSHCRLDGRFRRAGGAGQVLGKRLPVHAQAKAELPWRVADGYPSPSGGCISGPYLRQNVSDSSGVIARVPVRLRISSIEVAFEGHSGAKISLTSAASSSLIWSIWA